MIDRMQFARVMGGFADRIGRALAPATAEMYYAVLTRALDTAEFVAGAEVVFGTHQFNTWPAPQQFIDAAKPPEAVALVGGELFERVLSIAANAYRPSAERESEIAALGPDAVRAYRAAGGRREFENVLESDVKWLRRTFCENYVAAVTEGGLRRSHVSLPASDTPAGQLIADTANRLTMPPLRALPKPVV